MADVPRFARRWRNASIAIALAVALFVAVLPQAPSSAAQDVPSDAAQQAAADKLLAQLDAPIGANTYQPRLAASARYEVLNVRSLCVFPNR